MIIYEDDEDLVHYGTPRHSGRYPYGSGGEDTYRRNANFLQEVDHLKSQGMTDSEIMKSLGMKSPEYRAKTSIAKNAEKQEKINTAQKLKDKGMSTNAVAKQMGQSEATVRGWLAPGAKEKADALTSTANMLRDQVDKKRLVDIGAGSEFALGVSENRLSTAVAILKEEGYKVHTLNAPQVLRETQTKMRVLGPADSTQREVFLHPEKIQQIRNWSEDHGKTFTEPSAPLSFDSKRLGIRYKEDGGDQADGVIYVRPGVKKVELGGNPYAQVRIMVDDTHYIKGMAVYKDDLPAGKDLVFNTNKTNTGSKKDALKDIKSDPEFPFGSVVRQIQGKDGKPTSVMNVVNEEGDWVKWRRTLSSQMLSKQSPHLAKAQLDLTYEQSRTDLENIKRLTNPTVREQLLRDFAGRTDSASTHLKAAAMPRQAVRVLLPVDSISPTQVYAPGFRNGERVVLIRHPHAGPFEIPELTVNNRNSEAKRLLGDGTTAIGIHHEVAKKLSGADFDGDTVLVIPNNHGRVKVSRSLEDLKNFDPRASYPGHEGMKTMSKDQRQLEMGKISNLITDMSIRGASNDKIARAVRHSMVVIDAHTHGLNYKQSSIDNNIKALKEEFQTKVAGKGGASTLISRKKTPLIAPERKERPHVLGGPINKVTGELEFVPTNRPDWRRPGEVKTTKLNLLRETPDAHTLSSGTPMEHLYANHSNKLKALANEARLEILRTPNLKSSPTARKTYKNEVETLNSKLRVAKENAPLERQAQLIATSRIKLKRASNPEMAADKETWTKVQAQEINDARNRTGAKKHRVEITPQEWDAIQSGAISDSNLTEILKYADMKVVRQLAQPKDQKLMTPTATATAKIMLANGYTRSEVADRLGVSLSTLDVGTSGKDE
jgi:transposase